MTQATQIVSLRALGLTLLQVARVLKGDPQDLSLALAAHEASLENELRKLGSSIDKVRRIRAGIAQGRSPDATVLSHVLRPAPGLDVSFELPWPWGGERFALRDMRPINYIVGPLGSGKTRLALRL